MSAPDISKSHLARGHMASCAYISCRTEESASSTGSDFLSEGMRTVQQSLQAEYDELYEHYQVTPFHGLPLAYGWLWSHWSVALSCRVVLNLIDDPL